MKVQKILCLIVVCVTILATGCSYDEKQTISSMSNESIQKNYIGKHVLLEGNVDRANTDNNGRFYFVLQNPTGQESESVVVYLNQKDGTPRRGEFIKTIVTIKIVEGGGGFGSSGGSSYEIHEVMRWNVLNMLKTPEGMAIGGVGILLLILFIWLLVEMTGRRRRAPMQMHNSYQQGMQMNPNMEQQPQQFHQAIDNAPTEFVDEGPMAMGMVDNVPTEAFEAELVVISGNLDQPSYAIAGTEVKVGRGDTNFRDGDIAIGGDTAMSRHQFSLVKKEGKWYLINYSMTKATKVNGKEAPGLVPIEDGAEIKAGRSLFKFELV